MLFHIYIYIQRRAFTHRDAHTYIYSQIYCSHSHYFSTLIQPFFSGIHKSIIHKMEDKYGDMFAKFDPDGTGVISASKVHTILSKSKVTIPNMSQAKNCPYSHVYCTLRRFFPFNFITVAQLYSRKNLETF